jgi:hypothetical protein
VSNACPHCAQPIFREVGPKLKARTTMLVLHKSGAVEINCGACGRGVLLPLERPASGALELRKAETAPAPRLIVPKP